MGRLDLFFVDASRTPLKRDLGVCAGLERPGTVIDVARPSSFPASHTPEQRNATERVADTLTTHVAQVDAERRERWRADPHQRRDPRAATISISVSWVMHASLPYCFERSKPRDGMALQLRIAGVWVPTHPQSSQDDDTIKIRCAMTYQTIFVPPADLDVTYATMYDTFRNDGFSAADAVTAIEVVLAVGVQR